MSFARKAMPLQSLQLNSANFEFLGQKFQAKKKLSRSFCFLAFFTSEACCRAVPESTWKRLEIFTIKISKPEISEN
jgi:hypothetical protein